MWSSGWSMLRAQARHDAGRDPAQELHPAARDALHDRDRQGLRFRRLRRAYEARDGGRATGRSFPSAPRPRRSRAWCAASGLRPMSRSAAPWARRPPMCALDPNGDVTILIGTQSSGQGHQTAYAQIVAEQFGLPPERVHVLQGDTEQIATGLGTGGSASIPSGGVSVAARHPRARRQAEGDRGRGAGSRRRRSRDRRGQRPGRRHRPRGLLRRSRQAPGRRSRRSSMPARPSPAPTAPIRTARISPRSRSIPPPASSRSSTTSSSTISA